MKIDWKSGLLIVILGSSYTYLESIKLDHVCVLDKQCTMIAKSHIQINVVSLKP